MLQLEVPAEGGTAHSHGETVQEIIGIADEFLKQKNTNADKGHTNVWHGTTDMFYAPNQI